MPLFFTQCSRSMQIVLMANCKCIYVHVGIVPKKFRRGFFPIITRNRWNLKKKSFTCIWNVVKLFESVLGKMPGDHYILRWIVKDKLHRCSRPKNPTVPLLLKKVFNIFARISFFLFRNLGIVTCFAVVFIPSSVWNIIRTCKFLSNYDDNYLNRI